jgi:hypothetical protein
MIRTFLTLALSLFSLSSLSSFSSANPVNAPTYVCTTLDNIDRFDDNATAVAVEFPEKWFRTSYNGACVYDCEPYQAIGDLNVGFHVSCGTLDTSKMIEMDMLPGMVTVPPYLYSDYSDGTFKSFVGTQEYTICVYKNSSIEGDGGDCGYREDITRAVKKAFTTQDKHRLAYNRLRYTHSKMLKEYERTRSKIVHKKMKKVRAEMKVLLTRIH